MWKPLYICTMLATSGPVYLYDVAAAHAASGYWNNSGFAISHEFYPGRQSSFSYYNYAPRYYGFNRFYFGEPQPRFHVGAEPEISPAPVDWAKKCGSSCLDLSGDR